MLNYNKLFFNISTVLFLMSGMGYNYIDASSRNEVLSSLRKECVIDIVGQKQFDLIQNLIKEKIEEGNNKIVVRLRKGEYQYSNNHIFFNNNDYSDVSVLIQGEGSKVFSSPVKMNDFYSIQNNYLTEGKEYFDYWSPVYHSDTLIRIVDLEKKVCVVKCAGIGKRLARATTESYMQITQWYQSKIYKVEKIEGDNVYIVVPELTKMTDINSVNYDYSLHKIMPRFRLCNVEGQLIHEAKSKPVRLSAGCFLRIKGSSFKSFSIDGIYFIGNTSNNNLLSVKESSFEKGLSVSNCVFSLMKGGVLFASKTDKITVDKNTFENNYSSNYNYLIHVGNNCSDAIIQQNQFNRCGISLSYSICVFCEGTDYLIRDNTFVDFGYCAIRCGVGYKDVKTKPSRGLVEHNIMYYTKDYLSNIDDYGLIDGGAIYIATKNDDLVVRYNYIHDISGLGSNRGIYCDDGAKNFTLYGNIIMNIYNSKCIDARLDAALENYDRKQIANINKVMNYNVVNGSIRFEGKPIKKNGCIKGSNYLANVTDSNNVYNYSDMEEIHEDISITIREIGDTKVIVDRRTRNLLKNSPIYKDIKKYIIW